MRFITGKNLVPKQKNEVEEKQEGTARSQTKGRWLPEAKVRRSQLTQAMPDDGSRQRREGHPNENPGKRGNSCRVSDEHEQRIVPDAGESRRSSRNYTFVRYGLLTAGPREEVPATLRKGSGVRQN